MGTRPIAPSIALAWHSANLCLPLALPLQELPSSPRTDAAGSGSTGRWREKQDQRPPDQSWPLGEREDPRGPRLGLSLGRLAAVSNTELVGLADGVITAGGNEVKPGEVARDWAGYNAARPGPARKAEAGPEEEEEAGSPRRERERERGPEQL